MYVFIEVQWNVILSSKRYSRNLNQFGFVISNTIQNIQDDIAYSFEILFNINEDQASKSSIPWHTYINIEVI